MMFEATASPRKEPIKDNTANITAKGVPKDFAVVVEAVSVGTSKGSTRTCEIELGERDGLVNVITVSQTAGKRYGGKYQVAQNWQMIPNPHNNG